MTSGLIDIDWLLPLAHSWAASDTKALARYPTRHEEEAEKGSHSREDLETSTEAGSAPRPRSRRFVEGLQEL